MSATRGSVHWACSLDVCVTDLWVFRELVVATVSVRTRLATDEDLAVIADLWDELRELGPLGPFGPPASEETISQRLTELAHTSEHRIVLAEVNDEIVGLGVLSRLPITPISEVGSVQISYMHVRNDRRRRGVGRAIVDAALNFATEVSADYVTVGVFPGARDTNRFFARLGFSPLVVRRAITTAALSRKLATDGGTRAMLTRRRRRLQES